MLSPKCLYIKLSGLRTVKKSGGRIRGSGRNLSSGLGHGCRVVSGLVSGLILPLFLLNKGKRKKHVLYNDL
jgi:hypothetical protein